MYRPANAYAAPKNAPNKIFRFFILMSSTFEQTYSDMKSIIKFITNNTSAYIIKANHILKKYLVQLYSSKPIKNVSL